MDQDVKPEHDLWTLTVDDVEKAISSSAWQDEFTLLLVSDAVVTYPDRVLLAYTGYGVSLQTTWGKNWEPWTDILSIDIGKGICFVDRGDPAAWDFVTGDFTKDNAWHDLDLSGIVPALAKAVLLRLYVASAALGKSFLLRKDGNTNALSAVQISPTVTGVAFSSNPSCPVSTARKLEYKVTDANINQAYLCVMGWWF